MDWNWHDELDYSGEIANEIRALIAERDELKKSIRTLEDSYEIGYNDGHTDGDSYHTPNTRPVDPIVRDM